MWHCNQTRSNIICPRQFPDKVRHCFNALGGHIYLPGTNHIFISFQMIRQWLGDCNTKQKATLSDSSVCDRCSVVTYTGIKLTEHTVKCRKIWWLFQPKLDFNWPLLQKLIFEKDIWRYATWIIRASFSNPFASVALMIKLAIETIDNFTLSAHFLLQCWKLASLMSQKHLATTRKAGNS